MDKVSRRPIGSEQPTVSTPSKTPGKNANKKDRDSLVVPSGNNNALINNNNSNNSDAPSSRPAPPKRTPSNLASSPGSGTIFGDLIHNLLPAHVKQTKSGGLRFRDRTDVTAKRGFRVQLPKRMLVNTVLVFLVLPIILFLYKEKDIHKEHDLTQQMTKTNDDEERAIEPNDSDSNNPQPPKPKKESLTQILGLGSMEDETLQSINNKNNNNNNTQESVVEVAPDHQVAHLPPNKAEPPQNSEWTIDKQEEGDHAVADSNTKVAEPVAVGDASPTADHQQDQLAANNPAVHAIAAGVGELPTGAGEEDHSQHQESPIDKDAQQNPEQQPNNESDQQER